jgi:hypothetical protein
MSYAFAQTATPEQDAEAKKFNTTPEMSIIYIA